MLELDGEFLFRIVDDLHQRSISLAKKAMVGSTHLGLYPCFTW